MYMCVCMWSVYDPPRVAHRYPWSSCSARFTIHRPTRIVILSAPPPPRPLPSVLCRVLATVRGAVASADRALFLSPDTTPAVLVARIG